MSALLWTSVAVLGALGTIARVGIDRAAQRAGASELGGTLIVNVTGSLLMGLLTGAGAGGDGLLLAGGALLGSFTTFSTWIDGSRQLAERRGAQAMWRSIAACLAAGLLAALLGRALAIPLA